MAVSNGQIANATTFNGAFLSRTINTSTVGVLTLNNTSDVNSGAQITNTQRALNEIFNAVGMTGEGDASRNNYASNNVVSDGVSRQVAIGQLDAAFNTITGHDHDGSNSKSLSALNLSDINLYRADFVQVDLVPSSEIEDFNFFLQVGDVNYDIDTTGRELTLGNSLGYLWFKVTDGVNGPQTDPGGTGTAVMVNILTTDNDVAIATKAQAALAAASISGILSSAVVGTSLRVTYNVGAITPGSAGTSGVTFSIVQLGIGVSGVSGFSTNVSGPFSTSTPGGNTAQAGVVTVPPYNKVEIRNYETQTFIEDTDGEKIYARLTEASGTWTLTYYKLLAGVETAYSLPSQNISLFYREVFTLANVPTFGADAGIFGSFDLTADIVDASETQAGKILLANAVASSVGSANVKGTSTRAAHADHAHQGIHAVQEFTEAVNVYGDIILKGSGATSVSRTGQTFTVSSTVVTPFKDKITLTPTDITNGYVTLSHTPIANTVKLFVSGLASRDPDDFTVSGAVVTISAHTPTLISGDDLFFYYSY